MRRTKLNEQNQTLSGKWCYGKTPMQTFLDSLYIAKEKMIGYELQKEVVEVSRYMTDN